MKTTALLAAAAAALLLPASADAGKRVGARGLGAVAKPAAAPVAAPPSDIIKVKDADVKFNFGDDYVLGAKTAALPDVEDETFAALSISQKQVVAVLRDKTAELEYCWLRLPAAKRTAATASLQLMIEPSGAVAGAFVEGALPAGVAACIEKIAARWTFPAADAGAEIDHPLSFNAKSDALR